MNTRPLLAVFLLFAVVGCGANSSPTAPPPPTPDPLAGFTLSGDPSSGNGATWTYRQQVEGVSYDLQGILLKPQGPGPFPAVIISHGAGGNAGGVAIGAPGTSNDAGASTANVQRARRMVGILGGLGYVDVSRIALHGHSMGAFVTAATAGAFPDLFRAATHTAGGIRPDFVSAPAPTESQVASIRAPYQMHHGDRDFVVLLLADQLMDAVLTARGVDHELVIYPGADHDDVSQNSTMLARVRAWYQAKGLLR